VRTIGTYLPVLACAAMMLLVCVPMMLGRKHGQADDENGYKQGIAELREEIALLKAERALEDKSEALDG